MNDVWTAPGPGSWQMDDAHYIGAMSGLLADAFPPSFVRGWTDGFRRYGVIIERIDLALVGGRIFGRIKPVGAPEPKDGAARRPPPKAIMRIICELHPEFRRRRRAATTAIEQRIWRTDRERWRTELAPRFREQLLALQSEDPATMDDGELRTHVASLAARFDEGNAQHFRQNPASIFPVGDFVARTCDWTGCSIADAAACLQGSNPSSSDTVTMLGPLLDAVRNSPAALAAVRDDGNPSTRLEKLRASSTDVADALDAYLTEHGNRIATGFDITDRTLTEMPGTLLSSIEARLESRDAPDLHGPSDVAAAKLRERVPVAERGSFDEALAEARAAYGLHDEDVGICYLWPIGLLRRALLVAGERLATKGAIADADHIFDATSSEIGALLGGPGAAPTRDELTGRVARRAELSELEAPKFLGPPMEPPSPDLFPAVLGRMMRGMLTYISDANFARDPDGPRGLHGVGASRGSYEGRARIVCTPDEFDGLEPGDVLVAPITSPAYNVVLPLIGAVVTDRGGALSHAAIVAREFGIPAVVGTIDATRLIPDGARVRVDGDAGVVDVLP